MCDLPIVLRRALESLAFRAHEMDAQSLADEISSHLRHHPDPWMAWSLYQTAWETLYELEHDQGNPYEVSDLPTTYSGPIAREIATIQWRERKENILAGIIEFEAAA
jgi:hypothetical protein